MTTRQNGGSNAPQPDGLLQPELFGAKPHRPQRHNKQPEQGKYLHDFSWASSDWGSLGQRGSDCKPESSSSVSERPSNPPVTEADPTPARWIGLPSQALPRKNGITTCPK